MSDEANRVSPKLYGFDLTTKKAEVTPTMVSEVGCCLDDLVGGRRKSVLAGDCDRCWCLTVAKVRVWYLALIP